MHQIMRGQADTRAPEWVVPAYCEQCGEVHIGMRSTADLPLGYRYRVFTLYAGTCPRCRSVRQASEPGATFRH